MSACVMSGLAHLFGILSFILILVWLLHFREGIDYASVNPFRVFNVHPLMMFLSLIFLAGEAIMAFQTVPAQRHIKKFFHMALHLIAIVLGIVGLCAVFKFHDMLHIPHLYSLHGWIGILTLCSYGLQWVFGLVTFLVPGAQDATRARVLPWHKIGGKVLFLMAICAAETGLMEKAGFLSLKAHQTETSLVTFTGLSILLFGAFVFVSIGIR
ncbi:putative ascorbate ferrireductase (transmembrane) [Medicago truncatula]|uniref:ascorbate ferrireductase (transmembrane) n=1 Tax=Medicago truncatula TaxID=3880 RepID=A0A072VRC8_MEDTR|nr:probable transmembrane ascorbate ferrireductase 3 [Medicago truncatula]KEH40690.1 transmembrane ascorbate ferrireductase [Medicago truncatula]RHN78111.1 putative ascorbate ferrireductase (transmembrane) [Medicago truncatula]